MKTSLRIAILLVTMILASCESPDGSSLFDGKSLKGWEGPDGVFRAEDGCIVGGSMDKPLDHSYYLCTEKKYDNFDLTFKAKFENKGKYENAGVSFRAERVPNSTQVAGYQADMGYIEPDIIPIFSSGKSEVYCMSKDLRLAVLASACQVMMPKMILIKASRL